jgi:hypothetical protein
MKNMKCNVFIFFATHNFKEIMGSAISTREYCFVIYIYTIKYFNTTSCKYILKICTHVPCKCKSQKKYKMKCKCKNIDMMIYIYMILYNVSKWSFIFTITKLVKDSRVPNLSKVLSYFIYQDFACVICTSLTYIS